MKINEIFLSIQGEGPQVGMLSWFIRVAGCNLDCNFCDSKYAKIGKDMSKESIFKAIPPLVCNNVVITGGEPLLQTDKLLGLLRMLPHNIYIETNGTVYDSNLIGFGSFIVSPKLQYLNHKYLKVLKKWSGLATFKFVIDNKVDFDAAVELCKDLELDTYSKMYPVYFMPQGISDKELKAKMISITEWIKEGAPFVRLSPRLQIHLYGNRRGI